MKLSGEVKGGRLVIAPVPWAIAMNEFANRRVVVEIEAEKTIRSNRQNAYYHACVVPIIAHILTVEIRKTVPDAEAVTNKEAHEALKKDVLGKTLACGLEVVRSTRTLSTGGFTELIERGRQIAALEGFYIPDPGERSEIMAVAE